MTAPELSERERRIVAEFDAAPTTVEHMTGVLLTAILGDTDGGLVLEGDLPAEEIARLIAEVAAPAAIAVFQDQQDPAVQRVLALADELDRLGEHYDGTVLKASTAFHSSATLLRTLLRPDLGVSND